ncbi:PAS domain S-box protein [Acidisoma sp. 7E03]
MIERNTIVALLLDMFTSAPVPICISLAGPNSRYLQVNDAYLALVGRTWEELREQDLVASGAAVPSPERERRMRLLEEHGSYSQEEATIRHADGRLFYCLISARRATVDGESYDVEIFLDITERKRLERELESYLRHGTTG